MDSPDSHRPESGHLINDNHSTMKNDNAEKANTTPEVLEFSTEGQSQPVNIGGKQFELREMHGENRDLYMNDLQQRMTFDKEGKPAGLKDHVGLVAKLIWLSIYPRVEGVKKPDIKEIQSWPSSLQKSLAAISKRLSGLDDEKPQAVEAAKKDSPASAETGSP